MALFYRLDLKIFFMINFYDKKLFISKSELAKMAGVSSRTFRRYLATRRPILESLGITPKTQKLPPDVVRYICEDYCIDLPPAYQDAPKKMDIKC